MRVRPLNLDAPADCEAWDLCCRASGDAWFWNTSDWLRYQRAYRPELRSRNRSFAVEAGGRVLGLAALLEESHDGRCELGAGGGPAPVPVFLADVDGQKRREVAAKLFEEVDVVARECGAVRASFRSSVLGSAPLEQARFGNPLLEFGYLDVSLRTQLIDLTQDEEQLWAGLRKGHRSDVRKAEKALEAVVFDAGSINDEAFAAYRALHAKAAGRVTRPPATFELMHDWIRRGDALLLAARQGASYASFALLIVYNSGAYYASGANDPDVEGLGISHLVQWRALQELRERGVRRYEIGWQQQQPVPHDVASAKERSISAFKRGFGGMTVPLYAGEKYYSAAFYREVAMRRAEAYAATLAPVASLT